MVDNDVFRAKLAEEAERYDDMVSYVTNFAKELGAKMDVEQRNLLSVAYKNVVGAKRASWRVLSSMESSQSTGAEQVKLVQEYKQKVEKELVDTCNELLKLLDDHVLQKPQDPNSLDKDGKEALVFFYKMSGDYHRYIAEIKKGSERSAAAEKADAMYSKASEVELAPTSPIKLGLALNYSVFHYEINNKREEACRLAKTAFDEAISRLDELSEEEYKDATLIMQLIRDNLTLWTADNETSDAQLEDLEQQ